MGKREETNKRAKWHAEDETQHRAGAQLLPQQKPSSKPSLVFRSEGWKDEALKQMARVQEDSRSPTFSSFPSLSILVPITPSLRLPAT